VSSQLQVGQHLCCVDRQKGLDRFNLDNQAFLNQEIETKSRIELNTVTRNWNEHLLFDGESSLF
jgi:hypothetical protein